MSATFRTALVVDSGACLAPDIAGAPFVQVVPMWIELDGTSLRDGVDITSEALYRRLGEEGALPSSSSPAPGDYLRAFQNAQADEIVCLTIPGRFSTMVKSARVAADMLHASNPTRSVEIVDTGTAAGGFPLVAEAAARACEAGLNAAAVADYTRQVAATTRVIAALDTTRFLVRSGRIPALAGLGSDLLHVRPVFSFAGGDVHRLALVRGTKRALRTVAEQLRERITTDARVRLAVFCGDAPDAVPALTQNLLDKFGPQPIERLNLTPVIALHTGPGLVGAAGIADLPLPS